MKKIFAEMGKTPEKEALEPNPPTLPPLVREGNHEVVEGLHSHNNKIAILPSAKAAILLTKEGKKAAFTLAEVLITLGVIGVVAALTLPSLIQSHKEKERVVKLKKFYSVMSQAHLSAIQEYGSPDNWGTTPNDFMDKLAPYLKLTQKCGQSVGCWYSGQIKRLDGQNWTHIPDFYIATKVAKAKMADGTLLALQVDDPACNANWGENIKNVCGALHIDVNGAKQPNQLGIDQFHLIFTKDKIIPGGTQGETHRSFESFCNINSEGTGCAAWVIYNENQDYLHCSGLSWDGKTKCK